MSRSGNKTIEMRQLENILEYVRDNPNRVVVPLALQQRITACLSLTTKVHDDINCLFDFVHLTNVELMSRSFSASYDDEKLTGFVILHLRYFDIICRGYSVRKALASFDQPYVAESIGELLHRHANLTGRQLILKDKKDICAILERLKSITDKTACRYQDTAMDTVVKILGGYIQDLTDLIASSYVTIPDIKVKPDPGIAEIILKYTQAKCAMSPSAYGIQIPVSECVDRSLHKKGESNPISSVHLPNYLAHNSGTIAGLPGSGLSTLMRSVALRGNQANLYRCHYFYFSLKTFLLSINEGFTWLHFLAAELLKGMPQDDNLQLNLVIHLAQLNNDGHLVLLADDLDNINGGSRPMVIEKLAEATSIYFVVNPWSADRYHEQMHRCKYRGDLISLSLDGLTADKRDVIARIAAHYMQVPYAPDIFSKKFDDYNRVEGITPLGVLAALKPNFIPEGAQHLDFAYTLLSELLRRHEYPLLSISDRAENLDPVTKWFLEAGNAAQGQIQLYDPVNLIDAEMMSRLTVPLFPSTDKALTSVLINALLARRIIKHVRYIPDYVQFVYPSIEELAMTLGHYYDNQCTRSFIVRIFDWIFDWIFGWMFPGCKAPILRRVQQSSGLVPHLTQTEKL